MLGLNLLELTHLRLRSYPAAQVRSNNFKNLSSKNNRIYSVLLSVKFEHTGR
jgi:hypothetical protein